MPNKRGRVEADAAPFVHDIIITPAVATTMASTVGAREPVAEKNEAEHRDKHGLGLDISDGDHERSLVHRQQHQRRCADLRHRAERVPGEKGGLGAGSGWPSQ